MANNEILRASRSNPEWDGMACVLTVAVLENGSAVIGHVGDSRLYLISGGEIHKITHDHSPVGEREDRHELSEAEAMRHPRRNEVFRDVGSEEHAPDDPDFIEVQRIAFEPDAAVVLCSDGLSDQVESGEIRRIVEANAGNPDRAARELIRAANAAGGKDNVTVVVVEGEQFRPPVAEATEAAPEPRRRARWPFLVLGLVLGLGAMFGALKYGLKWEAPAEADDTPAQQVLVVGQGQAFTKIADAIAKADAGDIVEVLAGDYHEQVRLKDGVTVRSRVPREGRLLPAAMSNDPVVIAESAKNARIEGFFIQGLLSAAVLLTDSDVEVEGLEITNAATGIQIRGGSPTLIGNSIHDCTGDGISIFGSGTPWVFHNSIRRNKGAGVAAHDLSKPALRDNIFERNTVNLPADMMDSVRQQNLILDNRAGRGGTQR
jgi:parallel beta-helix repeat protein